MQRAPRLIAAVTLTTALLSADVALAAPADLDPGFGRDGRVRIEAGDTALAVAAQPDGKIVVAGHASGTSDALVARLNTDGSLDWSFGRGGIQTIDAGGSESGRAVAIQPDGKIVVAGFTRAPQEDDVLVARLTSTGELDRTFNDNGVFTQESNGGQIAAAVAVLPGGKVLAAGGDSGAPIVYRLDERGQLDGAFGSGGIQRTDCGGTTAAVAMAVQPDGKIVIGGDHAAVCRLEQAGALDRAFGDAGIRQLDADAFDFLTGLALQPDGRIVAAGFTASLDLKFNAVAFRVDTEGRPDATFNDTGLVRLGAGGEVALAVAVQPNGKIVLAGHDGANHALASRLLPGGSPDATFGAGGELRIAGGFSPAAAVALQADGKILLAGNGSNGATVVRLLGDPIVTSPPPGEPVPPPAGNPAPPPSGGGPAPAIADRVAPVVSGFAITSRRPRGARLRFRLSERSAVRIVIRRVGRRTRHTLTRRNLRAGANAISFTRRLAAGRYRATITATDAARNTSAPARARLTIARAR